MTTFRIALAGLLASVGLVLVTPVAAYACSCAGATVPEHAASADAVFTGTLVDVRQPPFRLVQSSGDPVTYTFEVDDVRKGDVRERTDVTSSQDGASCGLEGMHEGREYVVFASAGTDGLSASLCGGTTELSVPMMGELDNVATAHEPGPGELHADVPSSSPEESVIAGVAGLVAVLVGFVAVRRIRRRSA